MNKITTAAFPKLDATMKLTKTMGDTIKKEPRTAGSSNPKVVMGQDKWIPQFHDTGNAKAAAAEFWAKDRNHDGALSAYELATNPGDKLCLLTAQHKKRHAALDTDGDGGVSQAEYLASRKEPVSRIIYR